MRSFPSDHTSLITGASGGIGAATARLLAERGSRVVVHFRSNSAAAEQVVSDISAAGGSAFSIKADLSRPLAAQQLVDGVLQQTNRIDLLVNNAGSMLSRHKLSDVSDDFWDEVIETNFSSVFRLTRAVAPAMIRNGGGNIVNIASVAARNGGSIGIIPYASAKAAVLCMTKGLAKELIQVGIRVNAVNPGVIDTPFHKQFTPPEQMRNLVANIPQGRAGRPEEVASVVAFLASEDSSHIVGETIEVNGGIWMD
jgi:3-oxoacyl-[acyl-carrier protein] reductase